MDIVATKALDASMLLKTSCCHGHCNDCSSTDWLLRWVTHARRASLALLVLSGIIIYCIPQARKPAKKGCHLLVDLLASSLKIIIGNIEDSERVKAVEDNSKQVKVAETDSENPKSLITDILEETEAVLDGLDKSENSEPLPLYPLVEDILKNEVLKDSKRPNVSFSVSGRKKKRHKKQYLPNESDWLEHRKAFCEIHKPCEMKFKEKSGEKVSVCPMPLMQFDTFERQKLNSDSGLSNHKFHERRRKNLESNVYQNYFELDPLHFANSNSNSNSDMSNFEINRLNQDPFDDMLIDESFNRTPQSSRMSTGREDPSRPMKTMSWLSDQIRKFHRSLVALSTNINENIGKLKVITSEESRPTEFSTKNSKESTKSRSSANYLSKTVLNKTSDPTENALTHEKEARELVLSKQSTLPWILDWIFGEEKHKCQVKDKKILDIVKQKLL